MATHYTGITLFELLSTLGLRDLQGGKLTLSSVLEITSNTLSDTPTQGLQQLPWTFLRKLVMSNLNARNIQCAQDQPNYNSGFTHDDNYYCRMNPLDLITALFHCADPFLQQEIISKMSLCQFAVPLLLPNCDTQRSTMMLWAMRDLVKNYKPHSSLGEGALVEGRIVEMEIPMVSFVRVGKSSLSKSDILNKLLSNTSQHNEAFIHHDMPCGDVPRRISDGLVEISWNLPCGNKNIDTFTQPVAMANLRGDSRSFEAQVSFLCQTSAAVFIFTDDLQADLSSFTNTQRKVELFLVTNSQNKNYNEEKLKDTCGKHKFQDNPVLIRKKQNQHEFVNMLRCYVNRIVQNDLPKTNMFHLATVARQIGIAVDEDSSECQGGGEYAERISEMVKDVVAFKEKQLPLHGAFWKEISQLEKERYRMRNPNKNKDIEHYRNFLIKQEQKVRLQQQETKTSDAMNKFIAGISLSETKRLYFLKWLKIQLDTLTRHNLSKLKQQYKDCCINLPENKEQINSLDEQISNCSLGPEHFFRELGQIYECACSLPQHHPARQQVQHLPRLCAQMLLDGFPMELVDGDASNIPMKWISAVLTDLNQLVDTKSRILVLTVLGVQSTGKSTLLNTMFGLQFAVSSGRCTRGAFMLLMKVSEELRPELNCDFIMVIDTEGLKSPELAALDTSYEHDNELATLVIGLSDITIINVAMENNTEMKDILQIAVHAFLRMKEVGKKPRCLFVHQNVSDMSAHDNNMRDRNKLVEQLNEMTLAAAKMEKKESNTKFTDVMKYDPDKDSYYIPGLWHGTPPMAPVNTGYSEAVYELKKNLISLFESNDLKSNDATAFLKWTESLWNAVKFENFIFNFRNSLAADAYLDLCTHYSSWEWTFQSEMNSWLEAKTTVISNFGITGRNVQISEIHTTLQDMLHEASDELNKEEQNILQNIEKYFEKKDNKVSLVHKYKQEFINSAKAFTRETKMSIRQSLEQAVEIRKEMDKVNTIKSKQTETIEAKVLELIRICKSRKTDISEKDLNKEFDDMWGEIMSNLPVVQLQQIDVYKNAFHLLRDNLSAKSGYVAKMLSEVDLKTRGQEDFTVKAGFLNRLKGRLVPFIWRSKKTHIEKKDKICDHIKMKCCTRVEEHVKSMKRNNTAYNDTYIKEIIKLIDDKVQDQRISDECEANLKSDVISFAARRFQEAHNEFNARNDPHEHLKRCKNTFLHCFLAMFNEKDQCLKKAQEFTETCIKPAINDYVSRHLSQAIANEMKTGDEGVIYNTRTNFQFAVLKQLLEEHSFEKYKQYTISYEPFVKDWIMQQIIKRLSAGDQLATLEKKLLSDIVLKINNAIKDTSSTGNKAIKGLIRKFCSALQDQLVIPRDALDNFMILISVDTDQFASNLKEFINDMEESLAQDYDGRTGSSHITERIEQLPSKPDDLLFSSVCGCGHQCPFCNTPCEAGGQGHPNHFSSMHRPKGLGTYRYGDHGKLLTDICTTAVISDVQFRSPETNMERHPYKEYREIYPDWDIAGDATIEASDYWKYEMMKFNNELAEAHDAKPADIPDEWKRLTQQDALTGLKRSFNMK
ncbi:up-regulator of cell proliferation-like [Engraulis encrasicolus]|uniref:up-regulator of cell proliferation-like n=1 Tax=Engraulis encrasicolus TaxID=184585 RepID=UPI002FD4AAAD